MPALAELQRRMAAALLAGDPAARSLPAAWFQGDGERGLWVHRNTVLGACSQALRLSYPTLHRLLGEAMFDALAADFARQHPPAEPALACFGEGFAAFVAARSDTADHERLLQIGRYDWCFERVALSPAQAWRAPADLEGGVQLRLAASLRLFQGDFPVDEWRAGQAAEPAGPRHLALWRREAGVAVQALSPAAAAVLAELLRSGSMAGALAAVVAIHETGTLAEAVKSEILPAGFARLEHRLE